MARVACVTGATGFLASELVAQLLGKGYRVQATVRSLSNTGKVAFLHNLPEASSRLQLFEADLLDAGSFDACVSGADVVFHTASPFVTSNITDPHKELHAPARERRVVSAGGREPREALSHAPNGLEALESVGVGRRFAPDRVHRKVLLKLRAARLLPSLGF